MRELRILLRTKNIYEKDVEKLNTALIKIFKTYDFIITTDEVKYEQES